MIDDVCVVAVVVKKVRELVRRGRHTNDTAHDTHIVHSSTCTPHKQSPYNCTRRYVYSVHYSYYT